MPDFHVFICSAPADKRLRDKLEKLLASLKQHSSAIEWSDCEIPAGSSWDKEIPRRLYRADLILLLISPELLCIPELSTIALDQAVERHRAGVLVIPVLLSGIVDDIPLMRVYNVQPLPRNAQPITAWSKQDKALVEVAQGISAAIKARLNRHLDAAPTKYAPSENMPQERENVPPYYLYISDTKLGMLAQSWQREEIAPALNRYRALDTVLATLRRTNQIGTIDSQRPYIIGRQMMRWGTVEWGARQPLSVAFFFALEAPCMLLMAGSAYHLIDGSAKKFAFSPEMTGASGSSLPGIMSAIQFAADNRLPSWTDGIGRSSDYLFLAGFVREKCIDRAGVQPLQMNFPEQRLQFVARVLKRLQRPSEQQLQSLLADPRLSKRHKRDVQEILSDTRDILICSPLFVALDDEQ